MTPPENNPPPADDFWDLGDDDLELDSPSSAKDSASPKPPSKPPAPAVIINEPSALPGVKKIEDLQKPAAPIPVREPANAEEPDSEQKDEEAEPAMAPRQRVVPEQKPTSMLEKVALVALFLGLFAGGGWLIASYYSEAPEGTFVPVTEIYPVEGKIVTVEKVETWWREPIRSGPNADRGIQLSAKLIPCVKLTISGSGNGMVRYAFRDSDDQIVGDSPILEISNGTFSQNGKNEILLNCTGGFEIPSMINPYVNEDIKPWVFQLFEAIEGETPDRESDGLVKALIEPIYHENEEESSPSEDPAK